MSDPNLAKQTLLRATSALKTDALASMPQILQLVHTLSSKNLDVTVQELAELVKKDPAVLAKTLMVANGFGYNPNGIRVESAMEAIQVIGFERVRTLALSLLLAEQTRRVRSPDEQREAAAHALCSGFIAQSVTEAQGLPHAESAYVCGALRHFGRIVMTCFMTAEYRRARGLVDVVPEDEAFRQIFGLTPLELGHELLRAEQLPEEILAALRECDPASISASSITPEQRMLVVADFSTQLCELIFAPNLPADEFSKRTSALVGRFAHLLPGVGAQIPAFLASADIQLSRLKHGLGIRTLPLKCVERLKDRVANRDPRDLRPPGTAAPLPAGHTASPFADTRSTAPFGTTASPFKPAPVPPPKPTVSVELLRLGLEQLTALASHPGTPADVIYRSVIDTIGSAFTAPEVFLLLRPPGVATLHITHGLGQYWRNLQSRAIVTAGERTTFGLCLTRRENILIHDAQDAAISPYLPPWLRDAPKLRAFVLLPLFHADKSVGLILAGWATKRKIVIAPEQVQLLRDLLVIVARKHAGS